MYPNQRPMMPGQMPMQAQGIPQGGPMSQGFQPGAMGGFPGQGQGVANGFLGQGASMMDGWGTGSPHSFAQFPGQGNPNAMAARNPYMNGGLLGRAPR